MVGANFAAPAPTLSYRAAATISGSRVSDTGNFNSGLTSGSGFTISDLSDFYTIDNSNAGTVEFWVRKSGGNATSLGGIASMGNIRVSWYSDRLYVEDTSFTDLGNISFALNVWYHIAIVSLGNGTWQVFIDGSRKTSASRSFSISSATFMTHNQSGSYEIDEIRFSKIARYSGTTYTVPTAAFVDDANTLALFHCDSTTENDDNQFSPVGQAMVATNINYAYQDYSVNNIVYVGTDSLYRPVFFFAYANSSNQLRAQLFRINNDGTITEGAEQSAGTQSVYRTVKSASEYEGAGSYGVGSGNFVYMCYENSTPNATFAQVAEVNQSALTCTFGTAVNISQTPDADQPFCAYVGNARGVFGARTGTGAVFKRYSRSGTTLTSEGTASVDAGFRIDSDAMGFLNNGSTQYRYGFYNTGNGAAGVVFGAQTMGTTNYSTVNSSSITSSTFARGCPLNNTNKILGVGQSGGTYSVRAVQITFNASSNPTLSLGTAATFTDVTGSGGLATVAPGHTADNGFVIYNGSSTSLDYRTVSASGTTLTLGSKVTMFTGLSSFYYSISATSAKVGTKTYLAGIQVRSSGKPYIFGYRLA